MSSTGNFNDSVQGNISSSITSVEIIKKFFDILYSGIPQNDMLVLCRIRSEQEKNALGNNAGSLDINFFKKERMNDVAGYIAEQSMKKNLANWYMQICTTNEENIRNNVKSRSKESEITTVTAFYVDIDYQNDVAHKKKNLPKDKAEVLDIIDEAFIEPTMIVHSGNGVHAYWVLDTPISTQDKRVTELKEINKRIHLLFKKKSEDRKCSIDSVFDLARILRIPGTKNVKYNKASEKTSSNNCTFEKISGIKYSFEDIVSKIEDHELKTFGLINKSGNTSIITGKPLASISSSVIKKKEKVSVYSNPRAAQEAIKVSSSSITKKELSSKSIVFDFEGEKIVLDPNAFIENEDYESLTYVNPKIIQILAGSWDTTKFPSTSECDFELVKTAIECSFTKQQIADLLIHFRVSNNLTIDKCMRPSYVATTINNAIASVNKKESAEVAESYYIQSNTLKEDNSSKKNEKETAEIVKAINEIIGFKVIKLVKHDTDEPSYTLKTELGDVSIPKIDDLTNKVKFQNRVAAAINRLPLLPRDFAAFSNMLFSIIEIENSNGSLKKKEIVKMFVYEYYQEYLAKTIKYTDNVEKDRQNHEAMMALLGEATDRAPFFENNDREKMFFFFDHFFTWSKDLRKSDINQAELRFILKGLDGCAEITKLHRNSKKQVWLFDAGILKDNNFFLNN